MWKIYLSTILTMALNLTFLSPIVAETNLPEAPNTGKPETETQPGGTRTGDLDYHTCNPDANRHPVSLLAKDGQDFTTSEYPSFWFYFPYTQQQVESVEFILKNPQEDQVIYRTLVSLSNQPGITAIHLPTQTEYSLELTRDYLWEVIISCSGNQGNQVKLEGWITRTIIDNPESYHSYIEEDIMYDAVTKLAQLYYQYPENEQYQTDWQNLLLKLGHQDLVEETLWLELKPITQ
ncbi:MAG: DUF928 domain-containing protein [Gloeocapsa sp. DLM2.Bin57]|nr:MAG: DUF928 domain-containing protein [Gloeocapsa sp. DLM2.Bin57]